MGAIALSEPIFTKFGILPSRLNSVVCAKFHPIWTNIRRLVHNKIVNRSKFYMGAISKSEAISIKFGILIFRHNFVVYAKFHTIWADITRLVHNKKQIGRRYIWELYLNFYRLSPISIGFVLGPNKCCLENFISVG